MDRQRGSTKHILNDPRWAAIEARDAKADRDFVYCVRSTGVYCRASCASRQPRPENVRFFATGEEARRAGFRPCKRCRPDEAPLREQQVARVAAVCRAIEQTDSELSLHELAERAGMSAHHLHRVFRAVTGLTPKQYAVAQRSRRMMQTLHTSPTVTEAIYAAGFNSNGRFYERSNDVLGMTPSSFRSGGENTEIRFAVGESSLGAVLVARSGRGICAILLGDDPNELIRDLERRFPRAHLIGADREFEQLVADVVGLVEEPGRGLDLPLDIRGTAFQQRVWQALRTIPAGSTASYTEIADRIGAPSSVRAVAQACGANALAVAVPCHRVVRNDGGLSGYRWGVDRKRSLLQRETEQASASRTR